METVRPIQPEGLDIHAEVAKVRETPDLWRVYCKDWLIVFVAEDDKDIDEYFLDKFDGRVRDEDHRIITWAEGSARALELYLFNLKGEFKHREQAELFANTEFAESRSPTVVPRSSRAEQELKDYSKRKLISAT